MMLNNFIRIYYNDHTKLASFFTNRANHSQKYSKVWAGYLNNLTFRFMTNKIINRISKFSGVTVLHFGQLTNKGKFRPDESSDL